MLRTTRGKLLFGGLVLTAFAKAATSFPIAPTPADLSPPANLVQRASADGEKPAEGEKPMEGDMNAESDQPPPVVAGLGDQIGQCEVPEEVLQALSKERALLEERKRSVDERESEVALAREKLQIEKSALLELKGSIEKLLKMVQAQQTDDLQRLIALYQNMKPSEAANIMNDLDIEVVIMVLGSMKPRVAAPILAKMSPVRARAVSKIILERSKLPGDQNLNGVRLN